MIEQKWIVRLVTLVAVTAACSKQADSGDEKTTVQGTVAQQLRTEPVNAVAIGADGRSFWSKLDARGDFKLLVPAGQSYRLVLAKAAGAQSATVAELVLTGAAGKTKWFSARGATTLRLGQLVPAGTLAQNKVVTDPTAVHTASEGSGRGGTDFEDNSGSGRGGTAFEDHSGRSGSGRGGADGESSDDSDDFEDDQEHADDAPCEERDSESTNICVPKSAGEMESTRNGTEDVADSTDFSSSSAPAPACDASSEPPAEEEPAASESDPAASADESK